MNRLFIEGKTGDWIQITAENARNFTIQFKEEYPVKLSSNYAYEIIEFLKNFLLSETL